MQDYVKKTRILFIDIFSSQNESKRGTRLLRLRIHVWLIVVCLLLLMPPSFAQAATHVEVAVDQLNIRSAPNTTSPIIGTVGKPARLPILTQQNGWSQVRLANGKTGWVINKYVKMIEIPRIIYVKSTVDMLNVRAEPNVNAQILQIINPDGVYLQVKKQENWAQIKLSDQVSGWVNARYLVETAAPQPVTAPPLVPAPTPVPVQTQTPPSPTAAPAIPVTPPPTLPTGDGQAVGTITLQEGLELFSQPDFLSPVVGQVHAGSVINYYDYAGGWYKISHYGTYAYLYYPVAPIAQEAPDLGQIRDVPVPAAPQTGTGQAEAMVRVKNPDTNLRSGPGTEYAVVGIAQPGQAFPIVQTAGDWYRIRLADQSTAYIAGWIVDQILPAGSQPDGYNHGMVGNEIVYIYHTHNRESWRNVASQTQGGSVDDPVINITLVGKRLGELLQQRGIQTMVNQDDFAKKLAEQKKSYAMSYTESYKAVVAATNMSPHLKYLFDIHRDSDEPRSKVAHTMNGKTYARVMFVVGTAHPAYQENKRLAESLHARLEAEYPGLSRGVILKSANQGNGVYNQSVHEGSLLLEFGGTNNTLEECYNTAEAFADVLTTHMLESQFVFK